MLFPVQDKPTILTMQMHIQLLWPSAAAISFENAHKSYLQRYLHFQLIFLKYVLSKLPNVYNFGSQFFRLCTTKFHNFDHKNETLRVFIYRVALRYEFFFDNFAKN